jgi:phosphoribosylformylglycinamidine cyclo-ligase
MYKPGEFDLAGFSVGLVDKKKIISPDKVKAGDILLGIPSSGPHSNGYSLIRKVYSGKNKAKIKGKFLNAVMKPTRLYPGLIHKLLSQPGFITGIANITGGGLIENIPRMIPSNLGIRINKNLWPIGPVFEDIMTKSSLNYNEMARVFNMGIGMVISVKKAKINLIQKIFKMLNEKFYIIGEVKSKKGFEII